MILTRSRLAEIGKALYGEHWRRVIAEKLGKSKRTIERYLADRTKDSHRGLPRELAAEVDRLIDEQIELLCRYRADQKMHSRPEPSLTRRT
jgi:hypothetical protein